MQNFLLQFNTEQDAQKVLPLYYSENWDTSRCIPDVKVWKLDDQGNRTDIAGWFIRIGDENGALQPLAVDETGLNTEPVLAGSDVAIQVTPVGDKAVPTPLLATEKPVEVREPLDLTQLDPAPVDAVPTPAA